MLQLQHIIKDYAAGDSVVHALKGIDLQFRESEFVAVLGHSGCGKTTLLNIIGGLDHYTSGDLIINGKSTRDFSDGDWDTYRNHSVGFVFQTYNLIPHQTVLSNVELALTLSGVSKAERRARAKKALEDVGLGDQLHKKPNQMSGGQMQRVAIARALVNDPDILLADEPTGALDSETSVQVMEILKEISKNRLIIMVTHNPELAETYATRIIRVKDGVVTDDSAPYEAPADAVTEQPLGRKPSMGFLTAMGLSLNNLLTKKGRTILTAFAGSIGIIGIALILALSNGIQTYIDKVQEDTLSSYPISIEAETLDMSAMVSSLMGANTEDAEAEPHALDAVYSNTIMYDLMGNLMQTETRKNNLKDFKTYLEADDVLKSSISAVKYSYDLHAGFYAKDMDGKVFKSDVTDLLQTAMSSLYGGDFSSYFDQFGAAYSRMEVWEEMLAPQDGDALINPLVSAQYDLLYGHLPERYDEVVLIVDKNNEISDLVIYCLGLGSQQAVMDLMQNLMAGEELESFAEHWSYEELCEKTFKVLLPGEKYQPAISGGYTDMSASEAGMEFLYEAENVGTTVKIVGILRPNADAVNTMMSGAIGYTAALTEHLLEQAENLDVLQKQLADPETDVLCALPFRKEDETISDEQKIADIREHIAQMTTAEKAAAYTAVMSVPSDAYLEGIVQQQLAGLTRAEIEANLTGDYAAQMNVDAAVIQEYIAGMDDETLFAYVGEGIRAQVREQYAAGVQTRLSALSAEQLAGMLDMALEPAPQEAAGVPEMPTPEQLAGMTPEQLAQLQAAQQQPAVSPLEDWQLLYLYDNFMPPVWSESSLEDNLKLLGQVDRNSPKSISIYASSFEDKDRIADAIKAYNAAVDEDDQIEYTDFVALLMSSITTIINAISYVLIAFVAISLVVSSIMIGIITYISVLERTKEIGVLRAIGASKRDVSRVFNAETLIIGFCAGAMGILVTLLLMIPINLIVQHLTGIASLRAILPPVAAAILVAISMLLTFIAGLIPSGIAARKDPVEALRTE